MFVTSPVADYTPSLTQERQSCHEGSAKLNLFLALCLNGTSVFHPVLPNGAPLPAMIMLKMLVAS
jgi:hypothetical protein